MKFDKISLKELIEYANTGADAIQRAPIVDYDTGIKCIRIGDISNNRKYKEWGFTEITEENYNKYKLNVGDILIARTGSTIGTSKIIKNNINSVYNNGLIRVKVNKQKCNSNYFYYLLQSKDFINYIQGIAFGTTGQPNMKIKDFLKFKVNNIPIKIQNKIVNILSKFDEKIELNSQINDNLLNLGDTLYKKYFKRGESKNYMVCKIKDVVNNYDYKRKPMSNGEREAHQGKYPYYGATSIIDYVDDYIFDGTYLLMGEDGTVVTNEGKPVLQYIWGKNWVNNHAHVLDGKNISTEHLMFSLRNSYVRDIITGAVQPKINQENMNNIEIILLDEENNEKFESIVNSIMKQYKNNIEQNKRLEKLRDTLLPKLMNGEIDLEKVEI